jgi:hypothetical protein
MRASIALYGPVCSAVRNNIVTRITIAFHCAPAG